MNATDPANSQHRPPAGAGDRNVRPAGGAAGVEIVGFPQALYARVFGDPDTLFVPLLDAAREAFGLIGRLSGQGEDRASAVSLCAMHLASSLLRDTHFTLGARGLSPENSYIVNFEAGTIHLIAHLYSAVNRRTSFFKIELAGNISGGPFAVRDPAQGVVILQVDEEKLRQPHFFAVTLPDECLRAQMDHERFGRVEDSSFAENTEGFRMTVELAGKIVPVTLRKKEGTTGWDIIDGRQHEWVGSLPSEMEAHLANVIAFVRELFTK